MKLYQADYADDNFEMIYAESDRKAFCEALKEEKEHGDLFNLVEVDKEYNEVRTIL
jgi:hypothetical protein